MDEPSGTEPRPGEEAPTPAAAPAAPQPPPSNGQPPSAPPGWEPPWIAAPASPPPPSPAPPQPPPSPAPPQAPADYGQWRYNPAPPAAPSPGTWPSGPATAYPSSPQDTAGYGMPPHAGAPSPPGPYAGAPSPPGPYAGAPSPGPYGGGPYGGGPYGGGPYGPGWHPRPPSPPQRPVSRGLVATIVIVGVVVAALLGGVVGHGISLNTQGPSVFNGGSSSTTAPAGGPSNAAAIAAAIDPALVDIDTVISSEQVEGAGTGMVLTSTGEILTNNHVIEGADLDQIRVTDIGNGKVYSATVVGYDRTQDVAVLQLTDASGLQTIPVGNSSTAGVGQGVVAVGNAGGVGGTPSYAAGSITATGQTISASDEVDNSSETLTGLIESNCNIVAGDSGGPLVSSSGKVVGMDTAASSGFQFANSSTQGYSIPINTALQIAKQIEAGDGSDTVHVGPTAFLGVGVVDVSTGCGNGSDGGSSASSGALVCQVVSGGPANQAGLSVGDVIVGVNDQTVTSANSLTNVMSQQKPGATVSVRYLDTSGQQQTTNATLSTGNPQ